MGRESRVESREPDEASAPGNRISTDRSSLIPHRSSLIAAALLLALCAAPVAADDFQIAIKVTSGEKKVESDGTREVVPPKKAEKKRGDSSEPEKVERPSLSIPRGAAAQVAWEAKNTGKTGEFKDVLVHFFVVKQDQPGQPDVPPLTKDVTYEGALTMDFKPAETADWKFDLQIDAPGAYLLRVETIGMKPTHGHDHFAAVELLVE